MRALPLETAIVAVLLTAAGISLPARAGEQDDGGPAGANRAVPGEEIWAAHEGIRIIDAAARVPLGDLAVEGTVTGIIFSPDGTRAYIAAGVDRRGGGGGLLEADGASRRILRTLSRDPVREVRLDAGGKGLHILETAGRGELPGTAGKGGSESLRLRAFDLSGPLPKAAGSVACGADIADFAVSPDGGTAYLLDTDRAALRLLEPSTGRLVGAVELSAGPRGDGSGYRPSSARLIVDADGTRAAALVNGDERWGAVLVDLARSRERRVLVPGRAVPRAGRFLRDGTLAVLAIGKLLVLDLQEGKVIRSVPLGETYTTIALSGNGAEIYLGAPVALRTRGSGGRGTIEIRDGDSLEPLTILAAPGTIRTLEIAPARPAR